jgi:hypothetical protein
MYRNAGRHLPEYTNLYSNRREDVISHIPVVVLRFATQCNLMGGYQCFAVTYASKSVLKIGGNAFP